MTNLRAVSITCVFFVLILLTATLPGAAQTGTSSAEGQTLHVLVNKSVVINMPSRLQRVLASNPVVIDVVATSPTQVVVEGKAAGNSSLILWDESGQSQMLDVIVDLDVSGLRTAVEHAYPDQQIDVQADGARLLLWGNVTNPAVADAVGKLAANYSTQVVNSVTVPVTHDRQVSLAVKIVEVDRTRLEQFGVNLLSVGGLNTLGAASTQEYGPPMGSSSSSSGAESLVGKGAATLTVPNLLNILVFRPDLNLGATIQDLETKSILQILAEPNLMVANGQKASFLAGGEFPFPVIQGGANIGAVTIQFRPFGVKLEFTPTIGRDDVVRLHVAPEVSTLDYADALTISGFTIPAISTRRAETEVELKDGQSFGIAGILDHRATVQLSKIPGIGDLPILGKLFNSKSINRSTSELVVLVTPHITDPVRMAAPAPPMPKPSIPYLDNHKFDRTVPGHDTLEKPSQPPHS
jgi:pilus assembly protein CpaC